MSERPILRVMLFLLLLPLLGHAGLAAEQSGMRRSNPARGLPVHAIGVYGIAPTWNAAGGPSQGRRIPPRALLPGQMANPAGACEAAVAMAEYSGRVPPHLATAIALTESGRPDPATGRISPWPWTINAEGEGHFYATKKEAIAAVQVLQARGVQSIDVGCMQVNLMYHPDAFRSLDEAFDPRINASYAVRFLNDLYLASRDWLRAVAAYHSQTPMLGDAYRELVVARWRSTTGGRPSLTPQAAAYASVLPASQTYASFTASTRVYGAFAASTAEPISDAGRFAVRRPRPSMLRLRPVSSP